MTLLEAQAQSATGPMGTRKICDQRRVSLVSSSSSSLDNFTNNVEDDELDDEHEDERHLLIKDERLQPSDELSEAASKHKRAKNMLSPLNQAFQDWQHNNASLANGNCIKTNSHQESLKSINEGPHLIEKLLAYFVGFKEPTDQSLSANKKGQQSRPADDWCDDFVYSSEWPTQQPTQNKPYVNYESDINRHWSRFNRLFLSQRGGKRKQPTRRHSINGFANSLCSKLILAIILVLLSLVVLILFSELHEVYISILEHKNANDDSSIEELLKRINIDAKLNEASTRELMNGQSTRWLVSSSKCHIPHLNPWHQSIDEYVEIKEPLFCEKLIESSIEKNPNLYNETHILHKTLTFISENKIYFTHEAISLGALRNGDCCYKSIARSQENDDDLEYSNQCVIILENGSPIVGQDVRLIEVNCNSLNYVNVHSLLANDDLEEKEALHRVALDKLDFENYYNVLMVGVDTMSQLNSQRQLNKTLTLLDNLYKKLNFFGYNKVGENTFPNLIPLLTGLKSEQLNQIQCWMAANYTDESENGDDFLDNCKYLWNYYQQVGYVTYFNEDWPSASTFNYLKPGFKHEPTSYYGRPFNLARKRLLFPQFESIGCASCQLNQPIVGVDLDNLKTFIRSHNNEPYFAFHWINCPQHDDLNAASQVDHILETFFTDIHGISQNDKTFVIFFSDHGYRWNNFVSTRIGHYESSLPLLTISPPKQFIEKHPELYENMKQHQNVLLTPFDIFKTLIGVRNLGLKDEKQRRMDKLMAGHSSTEKFVKQNIEKSTLVNSTENSFDNIKFSTVGPEALINSTLTKSAIPTALTTIKQLPVQDGLNFKQKFRIISLLDRHNSTDLDRSCIEAGIPDNYCVCHQFAQVSTRLDDVLGAAYYLVYVHLESILSNHSQLCHQLELGEVYRAELHDLELAKSSKPKTISSRRKREAELASINLTFPITSSFVVKNETSKLNAPITTARPKDLNVIELEKHNALPNREYNIMFSTLPGKALFQEVVRYYGDNIEKCREAVRRARTIITDGWASIKDKRSSVLVMNQICEFSVHSESISRLNLYKDQSKCVKNNIELKKICYCYD